MRHKAPDRMMQWKQMPKFCHTCDHYSEDGICEKYHAEPPEDFAKQDGACPEWVDFIPF